MIVLEDLSVVAREIYLIYGGSEGAITASATIGGQKWFVDLSYLSSYSLAKDALAYSPDHYEAEARRRLSDLDNDIRIRPTFRLEAESPHKLICVKAKAGDVAPGDTVILDGRIIKVDLTGPVGLSRSSCILFEAGQETGINIDRTKELQVIRKSEDN